MNTIPCQLITTAGETYAIPRENLSELVRVPAADIRERIDRIGDAPVVRVRQDFIPLVDLARVFGLEKTYIDEKGRVRPDRRMKIADRRSSGRFTLEDRPDRVVQGDTWTVRSRTDRRRTANTEMNIAVVASEGYTYGLLVDRFNDIEDIECQYPCRYLEKCSAYLGTTIFGSGQAGLILDILKIARASGMIAVCDSLQIEDRADIQASDPADEPVSIEDRADIQASDPADEPVSLLTFSHSGNERIAIDMGQVERLERFESSGIEDVGAARVVQYRGCSLPLFDLSQVSRLSSAPLTERQEILILSVNENRVGLMVTPPVDIVNTVICLDDGVLNQPPFAGSIILNGRTTLVVDADALEARLNVLTQA